MLLTQPKTAIENGDFNQQRWKLLQECLGLCLLVTQKKKARYAHCMILSKIGTYFSKSQKSKSMLEFQAHICWVITVDYKVRLGQVKSEFD